MPTDKAIYENELTMRIPVIEFTIMKAHVNTIFETKDVEYRLTPIKTTIKIIAN